MIAAFHRAIKAIYLLLLTPVAVLLADGSGAVGNGAAQLTAPRGNASSWGNQRSVVPHLRGMVRPGTRPSWMKMIGDAELAAGRIYVGQEFAKTIGEYRAFNPRNGAPVTRTGDSLRIILRLGPSGEQIVDTLLSNLTAGVNRVRSACSFDRLAYVKAIRANRLKQFEERVLTTALIARRHVMAAKVIADHGPEVRKAIGLLGRETRMTRRHHPARMC
jgi:hypothetical protein